MHKHSFVCWFEFSMIGPIFALVGLPPFLHAAPAVRLLHAKKKSKIYKNRGKGLFMRFFHEKDRKVFCVCVNEKMDD